MKNTKTWYDRINCVCHASHDFLGFVQKRRFAKNQCPVGIAVTHFITFHGEMHVIFSSTICLHFFVLFTGKGPWSSEVSGIVKIGQTMTMVLGIKDEDNKFDMVVSSIIWIGL